MLPSGAISRISPSKGFSAANTTRNGAPLHGAIGEAKNASSAASSQAPGEPAARESVPEPRTKRNAPAISDTADLRAATNWRSGNKCAPCPLVPPHPVIAQTMAEIMAKIDLRDVDIDLKVPARKSYGSPQLQQHEPFLVIEGAVHRAARRLRRMACGLWQGPMAGAAAMTLLRRRKCQVAA
jgi:hypothetical protein